MRLARAYSRLFTRGGIRVTIEKHAVEGNGDRAENVRARIRGATADEVAGGIDVSERRVILLAADIPPSFLPLASGDRIEIGDVHLRFVARPDDLKHRIGNELLAIEGLAS